MTKSWSSLTVIIPLLQRELYSTIKSGIIIVRGGSVFVDVLGTYEWKFPLVTEIRIA